METGAAKPGTSHIASSSDSLVVKETRESTATELPERSGDGSAEEAAASDDRRRLARLRRGRGGDGDSELVAQAKAGDRDAFRALVERTQADIYRLALRITSNEDDAGDVVQETYLRAYRGLRRFRGDAQFATWLYRITFNVASTVVTRGRRRRTDDIDDPEHGVEVIDLRPENQPETHVDRAQLRSSVREALTRLPPKLRAVVVLRDIYDLPHREIAEVLDISESAAKVRLHRARNQLRNDAEMVQHGAPVPSGDIDVARAAVDTIDQRPAEAV